MTLIKTLVGLSYGLMIGNFISRWGDILTLSLAFCLLTTAGVLEIHQMRKQKRTKET